MVTEKCDALVTNRTRTQVGKTQALQCGRWRLEKQITVETEDRKVMRE